MDYILYRNEKILTMTLPKNTLLFRFSKNPEHDLRGPEIEEGKYCLTPTYNVFFYPSPFVNKLSLPQYTKEDKLHIYILNNPVKIIRLLKPSKYTRGHRHAKRTFIKNCNKTKKLCLPKLPRASDPCFTDTIIKKYPEIAGMMGFAIKDVELLRKKIDDNRVSKSNLKYINFAEDINGIKSVPEIILHPLKTRPSNKIVNTKNDKLETNYRLLKDISIDNADLRNFMENHTTYHPETFTYTYKE